MRTSTVPTPTLSLPAQGRAADDGGTGWSLDQLWVPGLLGLALILFCNRPVYQLSNLQTTGLFDYGYDEVGELPRWLSAVSYAVYFVLVAFLARCVLARVPRVLPWPYVALYAGMWICSGGLLLVSAEPVAYLTKMSFLSSKLAPGTLLAVGLVFVGADPARWTHVRRSLIGTGLAAVAFWICGAWQMEYQSRWLAMRWIWAPAMILEVLAILIYATFSGRGTLWRIAGLIPTGVLLLSAHLQQARLLLVTFAFQYIAYGILRWRGRTQQSCPMGRSWFSLAAAAVGITAVLGIVAYELYGSRLTDTVLAESTAAFQERLTDDTRSFQYTDGPFFSEFWPVMPWGAGYPAEGAYTGEGVEGIDNGYLNTLYVTGVPMMLCFLGLLIVPVWRAAFLRLERIDAAVVACAMTYTVRLAFSTVPNFEIHFLLFVLLAGRCLHLLLFRPAPAAVEPEEAAAAGPDRSADLVAS